MSDVSKASKALNEIKEDVTKQLVDKFDTGKALVAFGASSVRSDSPYKQ